MKSKILFKKNHLKRFITPYPEATRYPDDKRHKILEHEKGEIWTPLAHFCYFLNTEVIKNL